MPGPDERPPRPQRTEPGVGRFVRVQRSRGPVTLDQTGSAEVTTEDGTTMTVLTFRVTYTGKVTAEDGDDLTIGDPIERTRVKRMTQDQFRTLFGMMESNGVTMEEGDTP